MQRALPWLILVLLVGVLSASLGIWWIGIRPYNQLPRPADAIEADWSRLDTRLPHRANPRRPEVFAIDEEPAETSLEQVQAMVEQLATGTRIPVGCTVLREVEEQPLQPSPTQAYHAARVLIEHQEHASAARIARDLQDGDLLALIVSTELGRDLSAAGHPFDPPSHADVRAVLVREAACGDRLFEHLIRGDLTQNQAPPVSPFLDFGVARLRYRDRMLQLIAALDEPDPRAALEALPRVEQHAVLTRVLAIQPAMVLDLLP